MERSNRRCARLSLLLAIFGALAFAPRRAAAQPSVPPNPFDGEVPANPFDAEVPANPFDEPAAPRVAQAGAPSGAREGSGAPTDDCIRLRAPIGLDAGALGIDEASWAGALAVPGPQGLYAVPLPRAPEARLAVPPPGQARREVRCLGLTRSGQAVLDALDGRPDRRPLARAAARTPAADTRWRVAYFTAASEGGAMSLAGTPRGERERPRMRVPALPVRGDDVTLEPTVALDAGLEFGDDDGMIPVGTWP